MRETLVKKTRKPHRCIWCGMAIEVGQEAFNKAWLWEGEFQTGYFHPECRDALYRSDHVEDGWEEGGQPRGVAMNCYGDPIPATG